MHGFISTPTFPPTQSQIMIIRKFIPTTNLRFWPLSLTGGACSFATFIREQKPNSWTYNFVEVSGHNLESSQTWGFPIQCLPGWVKSVSRGDCEYQGGRLLPQLRTRIRPQDSQIPLCRFNIHWICKWYCKNGTFPKQHIRFQLRTIHSFWPKGANIFGYNDQQHCTSKLKKPNRNYL